MEAAGQLMTLKEENDSLKCQLEAYINEAEMVKLESTHSMDALEKQIKSLQNALKGMQQVRVSFLLFSCDIVELFFSACFCGFLGFCFVDFLLPQESLRK